MLWSTKFVFVHIPRTGGTVLTETFGQLPFVSKDVLENKHVTARQARQIVGKSIWNQACRFTILRDPWEIVASWYRHCQIPADVEQCTPAWVKYQRRIASMSLDQFVVNELANFVPEGALLRRYVNQDSVEVLTLEEAVATLMQLTEYEPELQVRPYAEVDDHALSRGVRRRCWRDCEDLGIEVA